MIKLLRGKEMKYKTSVTVLGTTLISLLFFVISPCLAIPLGDSVLERDGQFTSAVNGFSDGGLLFNLQGFLQGDFDCDGDVDGSDLALFAAAFGSTNQTPGYSGSPDFDWDGDVDGSDLSVFAVNFGKTYEPQSNQTAVPEPAAILLLGTGFIGLAAFGRKFHTI